MLKHLQILLNNIFTFSYTFVTAIFIFLGIFVLLPFIWFVLLPIKALVFVLAKFFRPDLLFFLPAQKAMQEPNDIDKQATMNMCPVFIFDGRLDVKELQTLFQKRVMENLKPNGKLMYPELKMCWVNFLLYVFWKEDKNFDLSNHVRLYDYGKNSIDDEEAGLKLPDPEEGFCTEEDLTRVMAILIAKPWMKHRSPWEILVVPNFKYDFYRKGEQDSDRPKSSSVIIVRMHHAMCDGYSVLKMLLRDLMQIPPSVNINYRQMKLWQKVLFYTILPLKLPWDLASKVSTRSNTWNSWHGRGTSGNTGRKVFVNISKPIDTQLIKNVKNKYSVGYNTVLVAVAAGATKRAMEEMGQDVPKEVKCFTPLPLQGHPDGLVIHVSGLVFQLVMDKKLTRVERLKHTSKEFTISSLDTTWFIAQYSDQIAYVIPNVYSLLKRFSSTTLAFPNIAGPTSQSEFNGLGVNMVDCINFVGPGSTPTGTFIALVSLNGRQRVTLIIDQAYVSNKEVIAKFGDFVEEELQALLDSDSQGENIVDSKV